MQSFSLLGWPWWLWLALVVVVFAAVVQVRKATAKSKHRVEQERLAQAADATHEGAKTRHEGGA
ncbi:MAG: hypothetical protein ABI218_12710 [Caldimonas sp.]